MGCISAGRFCAEGLVLADLFGIEFWGGDCEHAAEDLKNFIAVIQSPNVPPQDRLQMITALKNQLTQFPARKCGQPPDLESMLAK